MDEDLEIARGHNAQRLLENDLLKEALAGIEKHFEDGWRNSALSNIDKREEAYRMLSMLEMFKAHLTNLVNTGKMAGVAQAQRQEHAHRERDLTEWDGSPDGQPRS